MTEDTPTRGRLEGPDAPTVTPSEAPTAGPGESGSAPVPERIGRYRILGVIGEGGMGIVYEAEQPHPKRKVALKVIRGGVYVDDARLKMFQREADTLGLLKHPGIASIYESGRTDEGQHFFAMELVRGETLGAYLRERPKVLTPAELRHRLALFRQIADAVHYAHQRGVIHRDLKPGNIIVSEEAASQDTSLSSAHRPPAVKVLDFGLARITEGDLAATMTTEVGAIKGTLPYMSPEQARGRPEEIDLRTDVYALGVILYEMLAGKLPYDVTKGGVVQALKVICEEPPQSLSQSWAGAKRLDPDVETIVGKALEKDADRRYGSAAALAEDVERYLTSQPIQARPPSTMYQLRKFARRNRVLVGGVVATFVVLVAGVVVATVLGLRAKDQTQKAEASLLLMLGTDEADEDPSAALAYATASLETRDDPLVRRFIVEQLWRGPTAFRFGEGSGVVPGFSPDGRWFAGMNEEGVHRLWRSDGSLAASPMHPTEVVRSGFAGNSRHVTWSPTEGVRIWSLPDLVEEQPPDIPEHVMVERILENSLVTMTEGERALWQRWPLDGGPPETFGIWFDEGDTIRHWRVDRTGKWVIYLGNGERFVRSLERLESEAPRRLDGEGDLRTMAIDAAGEWVAYPDGADLLILPLERLSSAMPRHVGRMDTQIQNVRFVGDGKRIASVDEEGNIIFWPRDAGSGEPPRFFPNVEGAWGEYLDPTGTWMIRFPRDSDQLLLLWDLTAPHGADPLNLLPAASGILRAHPSGRWLVAARGRDANVMWPLSRDYPVTIPNINNLNFGIAIDPDGEWFVTGSMSEGVTLWSLTDPAAEPRVLDPSAVQMIGEVSPDGEWVAVGTWGGNVFMVSVSGAPRKVFEGFGSRPSAPVFDAEGRRLAATGWKDAADQVIRIWDIETGEMTVLDSGLITPPHFLADGRLVSTGLRGVRIWDLDTGEYEQRMDAAALCTSLSPDRRHLLCLHVDGDGTGPGEGGFPAFALPPKPSTGFVLDLQTGETRDLLSHGNRVTELSWGPSGKLVASASADGMVRVGPHTGEEPHLFPVPETDYWLAFHPSGDRVLTVLRGLDSVRILPVPTGRPIHTLPREELLAKLRSLTNYRVARDETAPSGFRLDVGEFPGWEEVPTW